MEKIKLSKKEKYILRALNKGEYDKMVPYKDRADFSHLLLIGFVKATEINTGDFIDPELTDKGMMYVCENPLLRNPTIFDDKKLVVTVISIVASLIIALINKIL